MILLDSILEKFKSRDLLSQAMTHKSYYFENTSVSSGHNERLEFLGDSVLGLVLTDELMRRFPQLAEGDLSKIRASLVNESTLFQIAQQLELSKHIMLGKGEKNSGGAEKPRLLASTLEALLGAIYMDSGFATAQEIILNIFADSLMSLDLSNYFKADYKTRLQERVQSELRRVPQYETDREEGPDHDKIFHVRLMLDDKTLALGQGRSKKQAEQDAARTALELRGEL